MDCIFCKIVNKEISSDTVFEDDDLIVIKDVNPKAKIHVLIIPKKHIVSVSDLSIEDQELMGKIIFRAKIVASDYGIDQNGYKLIANTGADGGQVVPHLHFHLLGGEKIESLV